MSINLQQLRFEYWANLAAVCQNSQASRLVDPQKLAKFPTFYDWLLARGYNRFQLSAYGISKDTS